MKKGIILFAILPLVAGLIAIQSCVKKTPVGFTSYVIAVPNTPSPRTDTVIVYNGSTQTINLKWKGTGDSDYKWNVYFGNTASPALVASNLTSNSYQVQVTSGGLYYWRVQSVDSYTSSMSDVWQFDVNSNPAAPSAQVPAMGATAVSCNPTLAWSDTDPDGDALTYDVLLGTTATPSAVVASAISDTSFAPSATLVPLTKYYWQIVAHDPYGGSSTGPIWAFTTGALPISAFTGAYNADEPAESYSYGVNFSLVDATTIKCDNYWNSGWVVNFTLDLTKLTYSFPTITFGAYSMIESGIIDPANGKMVGSYTIWNNGTVIEQGVHTYTKL